MATNNSSNIRTGVLGTVLQGQGIGSDLNFSTATYPATTTVNQLLYSSATNAVSGLATANSGVLTTNTSGVPSITALATNGQLLIGATAGNPAAATLTASAGIAITNAANSISIAVSGGGFAWNNVTGTSQTVFSRQGYIANNAAQVLFTMNATNLGDAAKIVGFGAGGWKLAPSGSQRFYFGSSVTTLTTGYLESTNAGDCVELIALSSTQIIVVSSIGDITVV